MMNHFATVLLAISLGLFSIGCEPTVPPPEEPVPTPQPVVPPENEENADENG